MRVLAVVLLGLFVFAPGAVGAGADPVVIGSESFRGLALSADEVSVPVQLGPRREAAAQMWRVQPISTGYLVITNWQAHGCLTASTPQEVLVLDCIGTPSQSWTAHSQPDGSRVLANAAHPGLCLTGRWPLRPVELSGCVADDRDQEWRW